MSAAVVALALVAQATDFDNGFHVFALLVLPVALFIGVTTFVRIIDARLEDFWLVSGMNRLRHAYLEIAPELEPYFVTGHHDDQQGIYETYGPRTEMRIYRVLANTSTLVGVVDAALAGAFAGLVAKTAGAGPELSLVIGAVVTAATIVLLVYLEHARRRARASLARDPLHTLGRYFLRLEEPATGSRLDLAVMPALMRYPRLEFATANAAVSRAASSVLRHVVQVTPPLDHPVSCDGGSRIRTCEG